MNENRKELEEETWIMVKPMAEKSFEKYEEKLVIVHSEKINKGITGLMAQRAVRDYDVPAIAVSVGEEICTGSIRSARGYNIHGLFDQCHDLFIDAGGHKAAGGFSMVLKNHETFLERLDIITSSIEFEEEQIENIIQIDAELPRDYLSPEIIKIVDLFEPYGNDNEPLVFMTKGFIIKEINQIGKPEQKHLKLMIDSGKFKWPALYWKNADRYHNKEFSINDKVDIVYNITRDTFRGNEIPQIIIMDLKRSI